jgi:hypothetical protein
MRGSLCVTTIIVGRWNRFNTRVPKMSFSCFASDAQLASLGMMIGSFVYDGVHNDEHGELEMRNLDTG